MNRSGWLAAVVVLLASAAGLAQVEDTGRGFRRSALRGRGAGPGPAIRRGGARGGPRISGEITLKPLTIGSDAGRYAIDPDKIKMIRFLKPPAEPEAGDAAEAQPRPNPPLGGPPAAMRRDGLDDGGRVRARPAHERRHDDGPG